MRILTILSFFLATQLSHGLEPSQMTFRYQRLVGGFENFPCRHEKASVGLYEWDVFCDLNGETHKYFVHLVLQFYPQTSHGTNAYELLYWVTDVTDPMAARHDSSSLWFHNSSPDNFLKVLEASQGIEDDHAYLKLTLHLTK
jgi:hypothetical protein